MAPLPYTTYTYDYTASSASTVLSFDFNDDPGYLYLTNVSVTAVPGTVPEPSTVVGLGTGALMVMGYLWRKRRRSMVARVAHPDLGRA